MDLAIVGLPFSGKTAVFKALTAGHGSASADGRGEAIGAVKIPDERLQKLAELVGARKITPVEVVLHDLPPLFERGAGPSGPTAETLARADALIHVARAFARDDVPHPSGDVDADRDIATFDSEMLLNDLGIVERRLEKIEITARTAKQEEREAAQREVELLTKVKTHLDADIPLRDVITDADEIKALGNYGLLSLKPMLLVVNIGESEVGDRDAIEAKYREKLAKERTGVAALCARLEAELAELPPEEAAEFREDMGAGEGATDRVLEAIREMLGLVTFFTAGEKDTRAWTIPQGATVLQAAGRIHTDIERGFIRAEVIGWDKLLELGGHNEAKKAGQLRQEGKTYVVQEGDVINVLFNV
jgi:GTP-binding protein YchF